MIWKKEWKISTNFKIKAFHKNYKIGSVVDEVLHPHIWQLEILGECTNLSKNSIIFNYKTIGQFIFNKFNNQNLNNIIENKEEFFDKDLIKYIDDISNEPANEVICELISRLVVGHIIEEDNTMKGINITASLIKLDGIYKNIEDTSDITDNIVETRCECKCELVSL